MAGYCHTRPNPDNRFPPRLVVISPKARCIFCPGFTSQFLDETVGLIKKQPLVSTGSLQLVAAAADDADGVSVAEQAIKAELSTISHRIVQACTVLNGFAPTHDACTHIPTSNVYMMHLSYNAGMCHGYVGCCRWRCVPSVPCAMLHTCLRPWRHFTILWQMWRHFAEAYASGARGLLTMLSRKQAQLRHKQWSFCAFREEIESATSGCDSSQSVKLHKAIVKGMRKSADFVNLKPLALDDITNPENANTRCFIFEMSPHSMPSSSPLQPTAAGPFMPSVGGVHLFVMVHGFQAHHACTHTRKCMHVRKHARLHACMHAHMHVCTHVSTSSHVCMYAWCRATSSTSASSRMPSH